MNHNTKQYEHDEYATHIVGLDVLQRVLNPVVNDNYGDPRTRDVAFPHPCHVDIHPRSHFIVLVGCGGGGGGFTKQERRGLVSENQKNSIAQVGGEGT